MNARYRRRFRWLMAITLLLAGVAPAARAIAQDADAAAETPAADTPAPAADAADAPTGDEVTDDTKDTPPESQSSLEWLIETSGLIGLVLLLISIYFVALVIQLFGELRPKVIAPPELLEQGEALLAKRDYNGIYQTAKASPSDLGRMIAAGLGALSSGLGEAREAIDREGEAATVQMEKRISMLAVIGSLGPMIGLLGTLKGMIASFSVIAMSDAQLKASEVAGGISEALVLTFEGVILSVPAIFFYAFFRNRVATLSVLAQNAADAFLRRVHASARGPAQAAAGTASS
jgi:biopolymer transport protein ExbB